ncbi:rhomboid family intramembrane serine protease [Persicobacter psychrovividus]|uniref:Rhomboid family intramembrane serine protease n=1 Tax=Persicobacter psychrovividus TaxID=387638 RepID=A0ABN6L9X2_9BACT|nr:rhomboid family intramembrane serine protease [Persicobacter psychrovividus]
MMGRITPMVKNLLLINIAVYILTSVIHTPLSNLITNYGALRYLNSQWFLPFQVITYMFMHGGFWHIASNMLGLFFLAPLLEQVWGPKKFLIYYMACGIGAGILYAGAGSVESMYVNKNINSYLSIEHPTPQQYNDVVDILDRHADNYINIPGLRDLYYDYSEQGASQSNFERDSKRIMFKVSEVYKASRDRFQLIGASGAIFGIILAFGMMFPNLELMLLFPPIPIKAKYFALMYGAYELFRGVNQSPGDNVAHFAHIAGMIVGFIILRQWKKQHGSFY